MDDLLIGHIVDAVFIVDQIIFQSGFLEQLVELDNDLRRHRELGLPRKLVLSTLEDRDSLPNPWNFEFWTQEVAVEDLGMPLVRLGEPHPLLPR